jgi:hypothetical protein
MPVFNGGRFEGAKPPISGNRQPAFRSRCTQEDFDMKTKLAAILMGAAFAAMTVATAHAATPRTVPVQPAHAVTDVQYGGGGYGGGNRSGGHRQTYSEQHYRWCEDRYRSYNRSSNSYWTNSGHQRQCRSPYM